MQLQQQADSTFPKNLTHKEIEGWVDTFTGSDLGMDLINNPNCCFYIFFARSGNARLGAEFKCLDREDEERGGFLTFRGGSRPVLTNLDSSAISHSEFFGEKGGFKTAVIREGRNFCNFAKLEKQLHERLEHLKVGHRLWRKSGGAQMAEGCEGCSYGVHLAYNLDGFGNKYELHDKVEDDSAEFTAIVSAKKEKAKKAKEKRLEKKLREQKEQMDSDVDTEEDEESEFVSEGS